MARIDYTPLGQEVSIVFQLTINLLTESNAKEAFLMLREIQAHALNIQRAANALQQQLIKLNE